MAFQANKPLATDQLSQSQQDIENNFIDINSAFNLNHVDFNSGATTGMHKFLQMPDLTVVPAVAPLATPADGVMLYATNQALVFRPANQPIGDVTNDIDFTTAGLAAPGWCRLPSGILMKWGSQACAYNATTPVDLTAVGPNFVAVYNAQVSLHVTVPAHTTVASVASIVPASLGVYIYRSSGAGNVPVYYFVIGK
jgi:hypothetical protein